MGGKFSSIPQGRAHHGQDFSETYSIDQWSVHAFQPQTWRLLVFEG